MRRNSPFQRNHVELMPIYNRAHGNSKLSRDGDIALSTHKKVVYLEKEIQSEDTLQSVALEFNVPVSELKRINNIHKDNEIYARKIIKVPSNPLSLLLEKEYFSKLESNETDKSVAQPAATDFDVIVETVNNCKRSPRQSEENPREEETEEIYVPFRINKEIETQDESVSLLGATAETKTNDVITCNGADWGISWPVLIFFTLLLGVGGPVLYVFWFLWGKSDKDEGS